MSFSRVQQALMDENLMSPEFREDYIRNLARRAEQMRMVLALNEGDLYGFTMIVPDVTLVGRLRRIEFTENGLFLVFQVPVDLPNRVHESGGGGVVVRVTESLRVWPL